MAGKLLKTSLVSYLMLAASAIADDVYRQGVAIPTRGTIESETKTEVVIRRRDNNQTVSIPLPEITRVQYGDQIGLQLRQAEILAAGAEWAKAVAAYDEIAKGSGDDSVHRAARFGKCETLANWSRTNAKQVDPALANLEQFLAQDASSRFFFRCHELLGQLYLDKGDYPKSMAAFEQLATAPWEPVQGMARVYQSIVLTEDDQALVRLDETIRRIKPTEKLVVGAANVAKGLALISKGNPQVGNAAIAAGLKLLDHDAHRSWAARGYLYRAQAFQQLENPAAAVQALLYVDLLLAAARAEHAEALRGLAENWKKVGRTDRADEAAIRLRSLYPDSRWAIP